MKCIAAVDVDLDRSPIGTDSRAATELRGTPVLTRTVTRLAHAKRIEHLFVLSPPEQVEACRRLVPADLANRVTVRANRVTGVPYRSLVRAARKWSLDGWRGGLGGTCSMDEYTRTDELALLARDESADAVLCASASSPLIDPELADEMILHADQTENEAKITFAQAPPGLVGTVYRRNLLFEMGEQHIPPGFVLSYKPDAPQMDLAFKSCCYTASESVRHAHGRLITDTDRSFQTASDFLATGQPVNAETIGRWLIERADAHVHALPREIEIELTTDDQLLETKLRPRGIAAGISARGPIDLKLIESIAGEMAAFDDSLVVLGGFGEPLLHPRFADVLRILRDANIYGIAVRTNGLALDDAAIDAIIEQEVDVVSVTIDAWTAELYRAVQGADRLDEVKANLKTLDARRNERKTAVPLVVPEMVKSVDTVSELDPFFDGWVRACGWANIAGYNHYSGRLDDLSVMNMSPSKRFACRRIMQRAMVLADGRVPLCDQDFTGQHTIGDLRHDTLGQVWQGDSASKTRHEHQTGVFDATDLCARCDEWHRP